MHIIFGSKAFILMPEDRLHDRNYVAYVDETDKSLVWSSAVRV